MITYNEIYLEIRKKLLQAGHPDPVRNARVLVAELSGKSVEQLVRDFSLYTSEEMHSNILAAAERLVNDEPLEYITGYADFCGCRIRVSPDVLIPRPDTELLVETAVELINGKVSNPRLLDLCTGSGCIACALSRSLPSGKTVAVDISQQALEIARENIEDCNLSSRVTCMQADVLKAPPVGIGYFDAIVSNPPYVASGEMQLLDASVRDHEPALALDGGEDGLKYYRSIIKYWKMQLEGGGYLLFEVGENQAESVEGMLITAGFSRTESRLDSAGTKRVVFGQL